MLKFIMKVYAAGEINDWRRNRKKRKVIKKEQERRRIEELNAKHSNNLYKTGYDMKFTKSMLLAFGSMALMIISALMGLFALYGVSVFLIFFGIIRAIAILIIANNKANKMNK